ncbi:MAG TPA: BTAD domain-containing putative transcriptional regulator [Rhodopila sp.]|nr:BTAD domain-containing putative transcriptional regulator [Rhodopila sp.]
MDSRASRRTAERPALEVRLLGAMTVSRGGVALTLPASRKARGLFGYLALTPHSVSRSQLCDLLWDVPDDPRAELRWCLSKIRGLVDRDGHSRIETQGDTVRLDLSDCRVDAIEIVEAATVGFETLSEARLRALSAMFAGELLDGLDINRTPGFDTWLAAQRRSYRGNRIAVLERLVQIAAGDEVFSDLEAWLNLAPFDKRPHEALLTALARCGRIQDAEEHLKATARLFEAEGLDHAPIRDLWRAAMADANRTSGTVPASAVALNGEQPDPTSPPRRASVAVMPFAGATDKSILSGDVGGNLVYDVISRLAKLRNLFVIAQGTVFALSERQVELQEVGRILNVDYVVSGTAQRRGNRLAVAVELTETRTARILWSEVYDLTSDDTFLVLENIGDQIVSSIANEIETAERNRAILRPPNSLNAWEAHHRGLWHMYRFTQADNDQALHFFQTAAVLDPTFSRAHAGVSFAHFQNAFQNWQDRATEIDRAFEAAGQALMADDRDPAGHWAMGRALWLRERQAQALVELETAVDLSPNFAMGHYSLAFLHSMSGDPSAAIAFSDHSQRLSPFDPMLFGMLGARAMALVRLGRYEEAAEWGVRACARPNAHAHVQAIAAYSLALAGRLEEARMLLAAIRAKLPNYGVADFLTAMKFSEEGQALFRKAALAI